MVQEGFKRKLFSTVHKGFGGKLRLIVSGGAALSKTYWAGFRQLGFTIVEGYGLTETFGPITACPGEKPRLGSVGPAHSAGRSTPRSSSRAFASTVLLKSTPRSATSTL